MAGEEEGRNMRSARSSSSRQKRMAPVITPARMDLLIGLARTDSRLTDGAEVGCIEGWLLGFAEGDDEG